MILNSENSLFELLARSFPDIEQPNWEITPLAGLSGGTYRLRASQAKQVIRVIARAQGQAQASLFVNRRKEARILQQLQGFGHAPKQLARNAEWLLLSWCEGEHPSHDQFLTPQFQSSLAAVVAKLHRQPLLGYRLQLRQEIIHYGHLVDPKRSSSHWLRWHKHFLCVAMPKTLKLAPAHMDLHLGNIITTDNREIILLDWEYAANTDIGFSLETYFQANHLNAEQRHFFLMEYCEKYKAYTDVQQLAYHCNLWAPWVKYMMLMWYEVQWNQSQNDVFLLHSQPLRQYFHLPD
ncbi:phosphotransferase [Providencia burhodogranariea]|uniref:Thiamine kinase n=1 Tax=Providencia burhodogranariea DSM 19968 TaxID=1141662 RepID=K8X6A9_9GAMM|nr:thiamine kinase [Providencia burhodogranariea DSM 19968]